LTASRYDTLKMEKITHTILCLILVFSINAQESNKPHVIEKNKVKKVEAYVYENVTTSDSRLITKEYFNKRGRTTKIEIYDSLKIKSEYFYIYKSDTLRTERITRFNGELHSKTILKYDNKFREVKSIDYDDKGQKTGVYSKTKYNDRKNTEQTIIYTSRRPTIRIRKQFDSNNVLIKYSKKEHGKWVHSNKDQIDFNSTTEEIDNTSFGEFKLIRRTMVINKSNIIIGISGKLKVLVNDILINERYINSKGLLEFEKQYLNDKLIGIKKYKYVS